MPGRGLSVEALGVSGAPAPGRLTTTFRLAGGVLVDAGAAAHALPIAERGEVAHVLLTHAHLDHTLGLPFLLGDARPVVYGLRQTLDVVRNHLLDGHLWPDLSDRAHWQAVAVGDTLDVGPWEVEVGPAHHTVPCVSYVFRESDRAVAIVGDTRFDDTLARWVADRRPDACIVEASFPDGAAETARRSGHQTPRDIERWRSRLGPAGELWLTHLKPGHAEAVRVACEALGDEKLRILDDGDVIQ